MTKIIGYAQKQGNFTNEKTGELIEYDNIELYCVTDDKDDITGLMTMTQRAKTKDLKLVGAKELKEALNKEVYLLTDLTAKPDENGKLRVMVNKIIVV